jgi:chromosome partitioning protein
VAIRIAIGNNKGGSGKTATTVNLAAALAEAKHRVLVIDMDPQANASRRLRAGFIPPEPVPTMAEVLHAASDGSRGGTAAAIIPCDWPAPYPKFIDVAPSRFDLENRLREAGDPGASGRLLRALDGADEDYAITLIDCPPSLGHLTQLALAAAEFALITVEPEYDSVEGAQRFRDAITRYGPLLGNPSLRLAGVILSRVRAQLGAHSFQIEGLAGEFGTDLLWSPRIAERAAIKDATDTASPLSVMPGPAPTVMREAYSDLAARLLKEIRA